MKQRSSERVSDPVIVMVSEQPDSHIEQRGSVDYEQNSWMVDAGPSMWNIYTNSGVG
jgi:hypothetical protein